MLITGFKQGKTSQSHQINDLDVCQAELERLLRGLALVIDTSKDIETSLRQLVQLSQAMQSRELS